MSEIGIDREKSVSADSEEISPTCTGTGIYKTDDTNIFITEKNHDVECSRKVSENSAAVTVSRNAQDMVLRALKTDDDPSLNPWTLRMFLIGIGLSSFGSILATIFMFKPQSVSVSVIFMSIISYFIGNAMATFLPSKGLIGRWINPHSFNSKEHIAIIIMSHSASGAAYATEVLAAQKLYYNNVPSSLIAILLLLSSQLLGYGMAGLLRQALVYPTAMIWPQILPICSLIETLHRDRGEMKKRFKFFWIILIIVTVWEIFPQYIMPVLTGVSVFCLANQKSLVFTNIFGGSNGNEGLGLFSISFDWLYISSAPLFVPLITLVNSFMGYILGVGLIIGLYYGNVWNAMSFPFLAQQLFSRESNSSHFEIYNQTAILDTDLKLNITAIDDSGVPFFSASLASHLLTTNLGMGATVLHVFLWHRKDLRIIFDGLKHWKLSNLIPSQLFKNRISDQPEQSCEIDSSKLDPHYRQMLAYAEVPATWYLCVLILSISLAMFCSYTLESTLPWWALLIAVFLGFLCTLSFGILSGRLGFHVPITSTMQMIGGVLLTGRPVANMYFVLFGANSQIQALNLVMSLKFGQYSKLSPKCTFAVQILGTLFGAIINYILMSTITTNQREILLSTQGTNIWSGQAIQSFNSNAIAFGALPKYLFGVGRAYQFVIFALPIGFIAPLPFYFLHRRFPSLGFDKIVTPVIFWFMGFLAIGINSSVPMFFAVGFIVQFYVRKRYPEWFVRYNYLLAAAISGGTELMVFITTFGVQGIIGKEVPFPPYWGNNYQQGNFDFCARNPALS
ncbi:unnamed protein product [Blumeria hordei]|uniref:Oligopeptide transporter n=1 Tax=Blumeria hordei TaxID=2867405 RepID=A0A383UNB2_BLUHO|nr:unnamed protein product [Blumeria hordei]